MARKRRKPGRTGGGVHTTQRTSKALTRSRKAASATPKAAAKRTAEAPKRAPRPASTAAAIRQRPPGRPHQIEGFFADARHVPDALAEQLGESVVLGATSGEDSEEQYERERPEEEGGPFLETSGRTEFAYGVDESNPEDAEPAPWPAVSAGQPPPHRPGGPR
jgi:hypothetical protein